MSMGHDASHLGKGQVWQESVRCPIPDVRTPALSCGPLLLSLKPLTCRLVANASADVFCMVHLLPQDCLVLSIDCQTEVSSHPNRWFMDSLRIYTQDQRKEHEESGSQAVWC